MKLKITSLTVAVAGLVALMAPQVEAQLQVPIPYAIAVATNQQAVGGSSTNPVFTTGSPFTIPLRGADLNFMFSTYTTNNGTSNNVYGFDYQIGGVWTTGLPLLITNANNASNTVNQFYILRGTNIPGVNALRLDYFNTWQTNPVYFNGIYVDYNH